MYSFTETQGQSSLLHKSGTVEISTSYVTRKKPLWWVALKLLGVAAMVAVGYGLLLPTFLKLGFPLWQAVGVATGLMLIYVGLAFFFRPEANTDNMGWGGGLGNDPFQSADNVNRFLWRAHCFLGPGRFTAETLLDTCALVGLASSEEVIDETAEGDELLTADFAASMMNAAANPSPSSPPGAPSLSPSRFEPSRFEQPAAGPHGGQSELSSWKYFQAQSSQP